MTIKNRFIIIAIAGAASALAMTATEANAAEPCQMCCDKWNGTTYQEHDGGVYYAVVQKGLQKDTRTRVGDEDGYATETEAQEVADDVADELNGK